MTAHRLRTPTRRHPSCRGNVFRRSRRRFTWQPAARSRITLRDAADSDAPGLLELSHPFMISGALLARDVMFYRAHASEFRVAEIDGRLAGCVGIRHFGDQAELYNACVRDALQGVGVGNLLMRDAVSIATDAGYRELFLLSITATRWFERFGFRTMPRSNLPAERAAELIPGRQSIAMHRSVPRLVPLGQRRAVARPPWRLAGTPA